MSGRDGAGPGRRVLVVDDSADTARMMTILLRREGYAVRAANDGGEALEAARGFLPDVVLLDLSMPGMTGQEVAAALREDGATAGALIIAVSGYSHQGVPPGFDRLLVKPVDHDALMGLLGELGRGPGPLPSPIGSLS